MTKPQPKIREVRADSMPDKCLSVAFLGGVGEIGKNMTAVSYGGNILVIDAGMTFPTLDMPGVDYIIPDMTYLVNNRDKVRALLLTHGHEDHIGAITYFIKSLPGVPVYGSKLTLALVEHKCSEKHIQMPKTVAVQGGSTENIACFKVEFVTVSHSFAGALAIAIHTPQGTVVHTGDYKIDYTPITGNMTNLPKLAELGNKGVLLMLGESTNIEREGYTVSERNVGVSISRILDQNPDKRIIIATFASNVHRLQQIIDVAVKHGRRVVLCGRSMTNICEMAIELGELKCSPDTLVDISKIGKIPYDKLVIVATGSQGEPLSALSRMADGKFNGVNIDSNDTVILSSSPIPGNERTVYNVINKLSRRGANVLYESLRELHVSGHACKEEIKLMTTLLNPRFFIPVHGEYRHLKKNADLVESLGVKPTNIAIPDLGDVYYIHRNRLLKGERVPAGDLFVDGLTIEDMSSVILKDRRALSADGVLIVLVAIDKVLGTVAAAPDITYKGMSPLGDSHSREIEQIIRKIIKKSETDALDDTSELEDSIVKAMRGYIRKNTQQNPMIIPVVMYK